MAISWFITTITLSLIAMLIGYLSSPSATTVIYVVADLILVITINLFFWLPLVVYLNTIHKITLRSSLATSLAAAFLGGASVIGVISWLMSVNGGQFHSSESAGSYSSWTIGHIHYWALVVRIVVLWGINGIIFWKLYGKFATNTSLNRDAR